MSAGPWSIGAIQEVGRTPLYNQPLNCKNEFCFLCDKQETKSDTHDYMTTFIWRLLFASVDEKK